MVINKQRTNGGNGSNWSSSSDDFALRRLIFFSLSFLVAWYSCLFSASWRESALYSSVVIVVIVVIVDMEQIPRV